MAEERVALLGYNKEGSASIQQSFGNIIVSIVGTGVLGLPYAFRISGWAASSSAILLSALLIYYCMMLLVKCRDKLEQLSNVSILTYGDLARHTYGRIGRYVVETMVIISQCGGCIAYLVFIGQNLSSVFTGSADKYSFFICIFVPVEIALAWIRTLTSLSPLSVFADICNLLAIAIVIKDDLGSFQGLEKADAFTSYQALPFVAGVAVFCFEGFSMTLSLETSMREPHRFGRILGCAFCFLATLYTGFGLIGYFAYGSETRDIITLNLPNDWSTIAVKTGLCTALLFTFPVMLHPVHEIFEMKLMKSSWFQKLSYSFSWMQLVLLKTLRAGTVVILAVFALCVPGFGIFVSLVGSTVCALLAFFFPALIHLKTFKGSLSTPQKALDMAILAFGMVFAVYGTYSTFAEVIKGGN